MSVCKTFSADNSALFNMMYQTPLFRYDVHGGWMWDWDDDIYDDNGQLQTYSTGFPRYCYNDKPPHQKLPYEMFTNESDLGYHKQRVRYYIARYGYSTKIYEFELLSEPFHIGEQKEIINKADSTVTVPYRAPYKKKNDGEFHIARDAVLNYHKVIASYIKDSLQWHNQLIGVDMGYVDNESSIAYDFRNSSLPQIDIAAFNAYYNEPDAIYKMEGFVKDIWTARGTDMPVLLSECGTSEEKCSNYTQQPVDMMTLGFTKVAGFYPWAGYSADFDWNYTYHWKNTIRAQYHMNGDDVINTLSEGVNWWHVAQEARLKQTEFGKTKMLVENQYYGSYSANTVVGYVRNRTYNVHTMGCNSLMFPFLDDPRFYQYTSISKDDIKNSDKILVITLKDLTKYYVDWYSFKDGNYLKTDYIKTNIDGDLKLDFPILSADNPIVWYVVHQNAYSGMMQNETPIITEERVNFDFQPIEKDTANISFTNAIYPNPFKQTITVHSLEDDEFIITTPTGSIIMQQIVHKGTNNIFVKDLPKGLYFGELKNQRFIIKLERL